MNPPKYLAAWLNRAPPPLRKAKSGTAVLQQDARRTLPCRWAADRGDMPFFQITKTEGEIQPQASRGNQAWDVLDIAKENRSACAFLSHCVGCRGPLLARSLVQEAFFFFEVVNKPQLLLYFSASDLPFCHIFLLLLCGEDLRAESEKFEPA